MIKGLPDESGSASTKVEDACDCLKAALRSALSYRIQGIDPGDPFPLSGQSEHCGGWGLFISALNRIEFALDPEPDLEEAANRLAEYSRSGHNVWALVPLAKLSASRQTLRGSADYIQGWWERDELVVFTTPEIP